MTSVIVWLEDVVRTIPLPLLEVWGRFSYVVGLALAICAFGGFTFRIGDRGDSDASGRRGMRRRSSACH